LVLTALERKHDVLIRRLIGESIIDQLEMSELLGKNTPIFKISILIGRVNRRNHENPQSQCSAIDSGVLNDSGAETTWITALLVESAARTSPVNAGSTIHSQRTGAVPFRLFRAVIRSPKA
jgi:hypothetical protein